MVVSILQTLQEKQNGMMRSDFFLDLLDEHFPHEEAERQFATAVDWGRYAELFEYDASGHLEKLPYCKRTKAESAALPQLFSIRCELIEVP
jgi:NitT/TauT family transport system ATP-binding protein